MEIEPVCKMCSGDGFFSDFLIGIYPFPCYTCAATGFDGIDKGLSKRVLESNQMLYDRIMQGTRRLELASKVLEYGLRGVCARTVEERDSCLAKREGYVRKLGAFPSDYFPIEREVIDESWRNVLTIVDESLHLKVEATRLKIAGKTMREVCLLELILARNRG